MCNRTRLLSPESECTSSENFIPSKDPFVFQIDIYGNSVAAKTKVW